MVTGVPLQFTSQSLFAFSFFKKNLYRLERIVQDSCIPEELPALKKVLPLISVLRLMP
jgi:hypothetical protein